MSQVHHNIEPKETDAYLKWWAERNSRPGFFGDAQVEGLAVKVHKGVFSPDPKVTYSTAAVIHSLPDLKGKTVMDLGTGSGVLAIHAAQKGAKKIVAVDIQNQAVKNAQENVESHGYSDCVEIFESDVFSNVSETFDIIIANLPFMVIGYVLNHVATETYRRFFSDLETHLTADGKALVTFASWGDKETLEKMIGATKMNWRMNSEDYDGKEWYVYELYRN